MKIDRWIARWENEGGALPETKSLKRGARKGPQTGNLETTGLRRILVPIDFSPESLKTLRYGKLLAKRFDAKLHLVHVVTPPPMFPARRGTLSWAFSKTEVAGNAKKRLKNLAAEFSLPPRPSSWTVRVGATADEISEVARTTDADLIAIATRGYTGLKHAFLGNTTERVVREAPCPVLVVRDREYLSAKERARRGRTPLQFRKILVPVDFSECSRLGLDYALGFAPELRASLVLFHSVFVHAYMLGDEYTAREAPDLIATQQDYAKDEMEKVRRQVSRRVSKLRQRSPSDRPSST